MVHLVARFVDPKDGNEYECVFPNVKLSITADTSYNDRWIDGYSINYERSSIDHYDLKGEAYNDPVSGTIMIMKLIRKARKRRKK